MLPRNVRLSILLVQLVSIATLMRSVAFERWITVVASLVLLLGAYAAKRNRAWGVALMFAQAAAFPVAFMIGIAPAWFCLVGAVGAIPFLLAAPGFARLDRGAARLLATLAIAGGSLGAIAWKNIAWDVFEAIPFLSPSGYAHHGWIVAALAALGLGIAVRDRKLVDAEAGESGGAALAGTPANARIAIPTRIASDDHAPAREHEDDANEEAEESLGKRRRQS